MFGQQSQHIVDDALSQQKNTTLCQLPAYTRSPPLPSPPLPSPSLPSPSPVHCPLHSDYLTLGDLHVFLSPKDATKAFAMLGAKGDEDQLTLPIMCEAVVALVKERVALAAALKGSKTVVAQVHASLSCLENCVDVLQPHPHHPSVCCRVVSQISPLPQVGHVVGVIIHIIFIFLYLLVFGYSATQVWVAISGAILGFSFIFASYLSAIFTCIMYLLTVHPFEVCAGGCGFV